MKTQRITIAVNLVLYAAYAVSAVTIVVGAFLRSSFLVWQNVLVLFVLAVAHLCERKTRLRMPDAVFATIVVFIFLSMYLGKSMGLYDIVPGWDKTLHFASGLVLIPIAYVLFLRLTGGGQQLRQRPGLAVWFCFLFAAASAGIWEIYEYTTDHLFGMTSQMNSLEDTMQDIICGTVGGLLGSLWLLRFVKFGRGRYFSAITNEIYR